MPSYKTNDPRGWCGDPSRGAALGRATIHDTPRDFAGEVDLQPIALDSGGYDRNGTYFGIGEQLWWYAGANGGIDATLRAPNRGAAEAKVREHYPNVTFAALPSVDNVCAEGSPIEDMIDAYMTCALWSSTGDDDRPLDDNYTTADIADETKAKMREDCINFYRKNAADIGDNYSQAGHDLWLTRNHHGAGFWDRGDLYPDKGERLTEAAHAYGEVCLYVDDGKIYA